MPIKLLDRARYLVVGYLGSTNVTGRTLWLVISKKLLQLYGEHGAALTGLYLIEHDPEKKQLILRATNRSLNMVRAALCAITEINGEPILLFGTHVSGTIKKAKEKRKQTKERVLKQMMSDEEE